MMLNDIYQPELIGLGPIYHSYIQLLFCPLGHGITPPWLWLLWLQPASKLTMTRKSR